MPKKFPTKPGQYRVLWGDEEGRPPDLVHVYRLPEKPGFLCWGWPNGDTLTPVDAAPAGTTWRYLGDKAAKKIGQLLPPDSDSQ